MANIQLLDWYWDLPVITRIYFTAAMATTVLCALDVISAYHLYYNWRQIARGELWRLVTNFLFFGSLGIDFIFHMYFVIRYCRSLEEGSFGHKSADFLWCLLFGATLLMIIAPWCNVMFFGSSLTFMMVYIWGKRNPGMQISLLGLLAFSAPYLPWVLLGFSLLLGHDVTSDGLGIAVGHLYYFWEDVFPALAEARGWRWRRPLGTPWLLHWFFGTHRRPQTNVVIDNAAPAVPAAAAPAAAVAAAAELAVQPNDAAAGAPAAEVGAQEAQ